MLKMEIILVKLFYNLIDSEKNYNIGKSSLNINPILYPVNNYHFKMK
jgi:hypothetical protein